jgi:hypothetical protein
MRTIAALIALAAALAACAALPAAEKFPMHVDIPESDAKWQVLPEQVRGVYVQDGKRVWYELNHQDQKEDLTVVEKIIRDQFDKPSPQLYGAEIQFFEPGGRVWFTANRGEVLMSYDGKVFNRYAAQGQNRYYVGSCPNTGTAYYSSCRSGPNCQVGDTIFFAESQGVLCVTGEKSSYHLMTDLGPLARPSIHNLVISLEPDGKGILAHIVINSRLILHRWRDGQWKEVPVSGIVANPVDVAPWPDGVWVFQQGAYAVFVSYDGLTDKVVDDMVEELGRGEYANREKATERLISMAQLVRSKLEKAMKATDDPEIRVRLGKVLAAAPRTEAMSRLGRLGLQKPVLAIKEGGWIYVQARRITEDGKDRGPGMVLVKPGGDYRLFLGQGVFDAFEDGIKPLVLKEHALIWTGCFRPHAKLFDVEKGEFVLDAPAPQFWWVHAVKSDGTVFLGNCPKPHTLPIVVFRPDGKDPPKPAPQP